MKVELTYFKAGGKYYTEGTYETFQENLFDIWDEVRETLVHPGLSGKWSEGPILVNVPEHPLEHPRLVWVN